MADQAVDKSSGDNNVQRVAAQATLFDAQHLGLDETHLTKIRPKPAVGDIIKIPENPLIGTVGKITLVTEARIYARFGNNIIGEQSDRLVWSHENRCWESKPL